MADAMAEAARRLVRSDQQRGGQSLGTFTLSLTPPRTVVAARHELEGRVLSEGREERFV